MGLKINETSATTANLKNVEPQKTEKKSLIGVIFGKYAEKIKDAGVRHDVTVSDVNNTAAQVHKALIDAGIKVVSYDEKTGKTTYSDGSELYYNASSNAAHLEITRENDDGSYEYAAIKTDENNPERDYNEFSYFAGNGKDNTQQEDSVSVLFEAENVSSDKYTGFFGSFTEMNIENGKGEITSEIKISENSEIS